MDLRRQRVWATGRGRSTAPESDCLGTVRRLVEERLATLARRHEAPAEPRRTLRDTDGGDSAPSCQQVACTSTERFAKETSQ